MAHGDFLRSRYFGSLDGLRGVSIIPVVWHHVGGHRGGLLGRGNLGVDLFFAISGLLITTLLLRERDRTGTISLRGFYLRRTLRIFPLYYAVIALYVLLVAALAGATPAGQQFMANLPAFLTYTSNWFVDLGQGERVIFYFAWSLATEEQFYLMWPSVVRFAPRRWAPPAVMAALLVLGELARQAAHAGVPGGLPLRIVASVASPICLGCLAAYALHHRRSFDVVARFVGQPWSAPLAGAVFVALLIPAGTPHLLLAVAMALLVTACAIRPDHGLRWLLENRFLRYVGTISYGMYLFHMLCVNAARRALPGGAPDVVTFAAALALVICVAGLSHRHFESWFLRLKDRLSARPEANAAMAPAVAPER
ncbi:acyltransferase family protein [Anaeromyxobacter dehalogenans]|uniref:Acyltransferase 3 n=1 Tax=Anaeromyxobacter dehalogenans (strain 2CP-C) TaxID=290397 RepID=Q2IQ56_ANADE|nr:acyltransferase [Anaeromyxobacter dehalogenans]ABC80935.1 Acyltransferase 3 [Anaeromyxobacter dehalogenans 2CP-C]